MLLVAQRRHNGGSRKAEASLKLIHNVYNNPHFAIGRPMAFTCASFLQPRWCMCLPLPPLSNLWAIDLLGDLWATVLSIFKTSWYPWRSLNVLCAPLNDRGKLSASFVPSTVTWPVLWSHKGGSIPRVNGVLLSFFVFSFHYSKKKKGHRVSFV